MILAFIGTQRARFARFPATARPEKSRRAEQKLHQNVSMDRFLRDLFESSDVSVV
jgi:hypothetical protein